VLQVVLELRGCFIGWYRILMSASDHLAPVKLQSLQRKNNNSGALEKTANKSRKLTLKGFSLRSTVRSCGQLGAITSSVIPGMFHGHVWFSTMPSISAFDARMFDKPFLHHTNSTPTCIRSSKRFPHAGNLEILFLRSDKTVTVGIDRNTFDSQVKKFPSRRSSSWSVTLTSGGSGKPANEVNLLVVTLSLATVGLSM
jgi:hypothetical protein